MENIESNKDEVRQPPLGVDEMIEQDFSCEIGATPQLPCRVEWTMEGLLFPCCCFLIGICDIPNASGPTPPHRFSLLEVTRGAALRPDPVGHPPVNSWTSVAAFEHVWPCCCCCCCSFCDWQWMSVTTFTRH